jgi:4-amino-4-deoxy-L-arabinose transferase-like glycosyltransferase
MHQETYRKERYIDAMVALGLALLAAFLYLPFLGSYPLWDPWEAHYSQVAMEMVHHNSWWEPWYRKSTTSFWSKPILTFWLMVSSLKTFRINQVGSFAHAEFFLRLPIALMGATGVAFLFFFVRRLWNRRTGVIAGLVLATCPQYFLISRQIMVDIPFVVIQTIAMGFFALGLFDPRPATDDESERQYGIKLFRNLALLSLGVQLAEWVYWRFRLLPQMDVGSLLSFQGQAWAVESGYWRLTMMQGSYLWLAFALFFFVWMFVRANVLAPKTRFFYLFFFFSGLGFLAKGLLSIVIPGGAVLFYILLTKDWDVLRRMRLLYTSDKINPRTAAILGVLGWLGAVWFITYPMMVSLLQKPLAKLNSSATVRKLKRHEKEHRQYAAMARSKHQLQAFQSNRTKQMDLVRRSFVSLQAQRAKLTPSDLAVRRARNTLNAQQRRMRIARQRKANAATLKQMTAKAKALKASLQQAQSQFYKVNRSLLGFRNTMFNVLTATSRNARRDLRAKSVAKQQAARKQLKWVAIWRKRIDAEQQLYNLRTKRALSGEKGLVASSRVWRGLLVYNALHTFQGYYRAFSKLSLHQQIIWFTIFFLGFIGLMVLWTSVSTMEFVKAGLLAVPAYALLQQSGLKAYMVGAPVLSGVVVFTLMTPLVYVLGRREHGEDFKRLLASGLLLAGIVSLPTAAINFMTSIRVSVVVKGKTLANQFIFKQPLFASLFYAALFVLLFAFVVGIVAFINRTTTKESFEPFRQSVITVFLVLLAANLFLLFRVEPFQKYQVVAAAKGVFLAPVGLKNILFGPVLLLTTSMIVAMLWLGTLFGGQEAQARAKAFLLTGGLVYLIVAGSWVYVMNVKHGLRFMTEWFVYHHLQRLQGVIEKPNNSFDLYIKQIGFGMFPWSALIPIAVIRLLRWNWKDLLDDKSRRNLFFFCCFFFCYVFFTFSSTKFHHYIFPVVPFLAVIVAVWLSRLFREDGVAKDRVGVAASLLLFVLLAKDLMTNYKPLHQLFTYYTNYTTPPEVYPRNIFLAFFAFFGLVFLSILLVRKLRFSQFGLLMVPVCLFVMYVNVRLIPSVSPNFSFKSLWTTYQDIDDKRILKDLNVKRTAALRDTKNKTLQVALDKAYQQAARNVKNNREMRRICRSFHRDAVQNVRLAFAGQKPAALMNVLRTTKSTIRKHDPCSVLSRRPFGEYANWDERSTSYYSNNFSKHIGKSWKAKPFLRRGKDVFIMVDRYKLPTLRRMASKLNRKLYILARPHHKMWLVSTSPATGAAGLGSIVLQKAPDFKKRGWKRVNIMFGDKIKMVGVHLNKPEGYRRGDKVRMTFLFKCLKKLPVSWGVFIHADPVTWTRNRLNWDHLMADGLYPTNDWKPGEYIQDVVVRTLPRNYPAHYNRLHIYMGLWRGSSRLPVTSANVYHDGQNRARPITLKLLP